ncbi:MAG: TlpA family protein disulfide reductase [Solirubrobacterales bacterium]
MSGKDPIERTKRPFNYVAVVGVVFVLIIVVATINLLRTEDSGTVGLGDVGIGDKVAPFAVPVASSELDGDANVDPDKACEVYLPDVIRICDYFDKPLVLSFWFTKGVSGCVEQQDDFEELARRNRGEVGFLSINVRDDRDSVREIISDRAWKVPVGYDRDGAVSNIYRIGGCPSFLFIKPGGVLKNAEIGRKTLPELEAQVRSLKADAEKVKPKKAK